MGTLKVLAAWQGRAPWYLALFVTVRVSRCLVRDGIRRYGPRFYESQLALATRHIRVRDPEHGADDGYDGVDLDIELEWDDELLAGLRELLRGLRRRFVAHASRGPPTGGTADLDPRGPNDPDAADVRASAAKGSEARRKIITMPFHLGATVDGSRSAVRRLLEYTTEMNSSGASGRPRRRPLVDLYHAMAYDYFLPMPAADRRAVSAAVAKRLARQSPERGSPGREFQPPSSLVSFAPFDEEYLRSHLVDPWVEFGGGAASLRRLTLGIPFYGRRVAKVSTAATMESRAPSGGAEINWAAGDGEARTFAEIAEFAAQEAPGRFGANKVLPVRAGSSSNGAGMAASSSDGDDGRACMTRGGDVAVALSSGHGSAATDAGSGLVMDVYSLNGPRTVALKSSTSPFVFTT